MTDYDASAFPPFAVTVDLVVLTVRDAELSVLVVRRGGSPYAGRLALPGGFVHIDEDIDAAACRELKEETGIDLDAVHLEQLATYGAPRRDPRMRVVTVAYLALVPDLPTPTAGSDAASATWVHVETLLDTPKRLAFDHWQILRDGVERARAKIEYTALAATFCTEPFTVGELRQVYEAVWGRRLDPRNFHRKVTGVPGFLVEVDATTTRGGGRPAQLYRRGSASQLSPPLLRSGS